MYQLADYDYDLPEAQIAQVPCKERSSSRLLHLNRKTGAVSHHHFFDLANLLSPGDLLVVNNTRVIPARLVGKKKVTGGRVEVLIIDYAGGVKALEETGFFQCDCLVKASKNPRPGTILYFGEDIVAEVIGVRQYISQIRFFGGQDFITALKRFGQIPLPPYIKREDGDLTQMDTKTYQTVYAAKEGAVAAPTAGLHFTNSLMADLEKKGVQIANLTLHVGYGTFVPVRVQDIREHQIHSEYYALSPEAAQKINRAKQEGRRVIAVGTTSVRTLEYLADDKGVVTPGMGSCDLFIYPGYTFKCVDAMVTNFHLPKSTLLMLVSAFYTREKMIQAYEAAIRADYRFFSYGDAMLIE